MELPFAALHQLCGPVLERLDLLPGPQRDALGTVFGLRSGDPPDRFLVGLGVLSLIAGLGAEQRLICVVDDVQWLDHASAQTLAFVSRRLLADPVAILFAVARAPGDPGRAPGARAPGAGRRRCTGAHGVGAPVRTRRRGHRADRRRGRWQPAGATRGPARTHAGTAGGRVRAPTGPVSAQIEETFRRRLAALPAQSRGLLLVAASEQVGNPVVVLRAAAALGFPAGVVGRSRTGRPPRDRCTSALSPSPRAFVRLRRRGTRGFVPNPPRPRRRHRARARPRPPRVAPRAFDRWSRRGGRRRAGALGRTSPGPRRVRRGSRVPRTRGSVEHGAESTGPARPGRRQGEAPRRCRRRGHRRARRRRSRPAGRSAAGRRRPASRRDRLHGASGQRCTRTARSSGAATRAARRRRRPRHVPRRRPSGALRGATRS